MEQQNFTEPLTLTTASADAAQKLSNGIASSVLWVVKVVVVGVVVVVLMDAITSADPRASTVTLNGTKLHSCQCSHFPFSSDC